MRSLPCIAPFSLVLLAHIGFAQEHRTDIQSDGLFGPVRSVSTAVTRSGVEIRQPSGAALILSVRCHECTYTRDGYRSRFGEIRDGQFLGETIALTRDPEGRVTEVVATNTQTDQVDHRTVFGPFGKLEETTYHMGKIQFQDIFRYDAVGHPVESITYDDAGDVVRHGLSTYSNNGLFDDSTVWGKDQHIEERSSFDYATGEQRFTAYDDSGNVVQKWTYAHGQVMSFWEPADHSRAFGIGGFDPKDSTTVNSWDCHGQNQCEMTRVHFEYADTAKKNPSSIEWRDSTGKFLAAAYYVYTFDQKGNWTHREISVWSPELGARTSYETDDRLITYWE